MEESAFHLWVDQRVQHGVLSSDVTFEGLLASLPGVYPLDVWHSLTRLAARGKEPARFVRLLDAARHVRLPVSYPSLRLGLGHPHPLDFEWRFDPEAVETILHELQGIVCRGAKVGLVAVPTLALLLQQYTTEYRFTYVGQDADVVRTLAKHHERRIQFEQLDLMKKGSASPLKFQAVVMDPPWYDEHMLRFLWFAAATVATDGVLLMSMPAVGTRPSMGHDERRYSAYCETLGFSPMAVRRGVVPYETPLFERNALAASGITCVPSNWRRADLWLLRRTARVLPEWPGDVQPAPWRQFKFGATAVRVRTVTAAQDMRENPILLPLVPGDILPTVSRRDPRRMAVSVWTTGNRVFGCNAPRQIEEILLSIGKGANQSCHASQAASQIIDLLRIEQEQT